MRMKFLKASLALFATFVLTWLMFGFVAWDWAPANWEPMQRFALVWIASGLGLLAVGAVMGVWK
jgi:hypothetical protein